MIRISYDEPLGYGSTISFNINGRKFTGVIEGFSDKTYIFPRGTLISSIEADLKCSLKEFFSDTLRTSIFKYKDQCWPKETLQNLKLVLKAMENVVKGVEFEKPLKDKSKVTFLTPTGIINAHVNSYNQKTSYIWIEDGTTPDNLMLTLCDETIKSVYHNAGATIASSGEWPFSTLKDLVKVLDYINEKCHYNVQKLINTPIKQQQNGNEIKLQRPKDIIRSGKVPKGCGIRGKIHKATISSRPLENSAISG